MHRREGIKALDARRADAAPRLVDRASQRDRVGRVVERLQVRHRVLDLGALVEAGAADHLVGNAVSHEQVLEDARLRVRPVEDCDVSRGDALVEQPANARSDEACLGLLVLHLDHADRLALAEVGPEALLEPVRVVCDDGVRGVEDPLGRAVVLLEPDHGGVREVTFEVEDVADVGTAERVYGLIRVADREQVAMPRRQELRDAVLRVVGVLVLVDQQVREDLLPAVADVVEALEQIHGAHEQVVEVHRVRLVQSSLVLDEDVRDGLLEEAVRPARGTPPPTRGGSSRPRCESGYRAAGTASGRGRAPRGTSARAAPGPPGRRS